MERNTLESLPNEVLLFVFTYLSSFDLCQAFLEVKNDRFKHLLITLRHSLDVSSLRYNVLRQFLYSNDDYMKQFTALVQTVILRDSPACWMLRDHWEKTLKDPERSNVFLPSLKQIIVLNTAYHGDFVDSIVVPLVSMTNTLQCLHLVFKYPDHVYKAALYWLIRLHISVHTMILEVQQGILLAPLSNQKSDNLNLFH